MKLSSIIFVCVYICLGTLYCGHCLTSFILCVYPVINGHVKHKEHKKLHITNYNKIPGLDLGIKGAESLHDNLIFTAQPVKKSCAMSSVSLEEL